MFVVVYLRRSNALLVKRDTWIKKGSTNGKSRPLFLIQFTHSSDICCTFWVGHDPYFAQKKLNEVGAEYLTKIVQWACQECRITWKSNQLWWHLFRQPEIKGGGAKDPPGRFYGNHFLLVNQTLSFHSELATIWGQFSTFHSAECWQSCQFMVFCHFLGFSREVVFWQITRSGAAPARDQFYTTLPIVPLHFQKVTFPNSFLLFLSLVCSFKIFIAYMHLISLFAPFAMDPLEYIPRI